MNALSSISTGLGFDSANVQSARAAQQKQEQANGLVVKKSDDSDLNKWLQTAGKDPNRPTTREAFGDFVGQTFFGQLISSMRSTVDKPAYFHGGRAEEVFQGQLDQMLVEKMSDASKETFAEPMYNLFMMQQK